MNLKLKTCILLALLLCLSMGCEGYDDGMPRRPVNFYIYLYDASYFDLLNYGGYVYVTGGISGIVVYRLSEWEFVAFDRACPYDWDHEDSWIWVEPDRLTLKCQKCGSLFNILDGGIIVGPSQFPLRRYATNFDGVRLRVRS